MKYSADSKVETAKIAWEKPVLTVVATTADIAGGAIDDDEDFTGNPPPS